MTNSLDEINLKLETAEKRLVKLKIEKQKLSKLKYKKKQEKG